MGGKKRKNLSPGGSSSKSRKRKEVDYKIEIGIDEESAKEKGKKSKGKKVIMGTVGSRMKTKNKIKNIERYTNVSLDDDPLTQKNEKDMRGKKHAPQGDGEDKDNIVTNVEKDKLALDEYIPK